MRKDAEAALTSSKASGKKQTTQLKLADAFAHSTPYDHQSKRWKELKDAVAFCLAKDMLQLQTVIKAGSNERMIQMDA